jgi:hypothetical protein
VGGKRRQRDEPNDDLDQYEDDFDEKFDDRFDERFDDAPLSGDLPREPSAPMSNLAFEPPVKMELPGGPQDERTVITESVERPVERPAEDADDFDAEPGEEPTDASDLLVVAGLSAEVRVVDEHPRYHLATCVWLANRPTIPVAVSEARQLGFTPCARCGPDAILAARHRARAK